MKPIIFKGNIFKDTRGCIRFNNNFDAIEIKRIYIIENADTFLERAWQGHKVEQRWFSAIQGRFLIKLIKIDNWEHPSKDLNILEFELSSETLDFLHIPKGFVSYIKAIDTESKLLVLANFNFGEINDEYRFPVDYFKK